MPREKFEDRRFTGSINVACKYKNPDGTVKYTRYWVDDKINIVKRIITIVTEYKRLGYNLTLRQLHYQFVSNDPKYINHDSAYDKLGKILDDCKYSGLIDWDNIEDRGRIPYLPYWSKDVPTALDELSSYYRVDRQLDQPYHMELWTEKDALSAILKRSTSKYHIQLVVNKGYTSSTALYKAYERVADAILTKNQKVCILYFGDHDPSGLDMVRDIRDRLTTFIVKGDKFTQWQNTVVADWLEGQDDLLRELIINNYCSQELVRRVVDTSWGELKESEREDYLIGIAKYYMDENGIFEVRSIGLSMEQIKQYNLPPNPAKITDKRAKSYIEKFGPESWEVDALPPTTLTSIIETNIESLIDQEQFQNMLAKEDQDVELIKKFIKQSAKKK